MGKKVLGMDIGGTHLRSGFVDEAYGVSHFEMVGSGGIQGGQVAEKLSRRILHTMEQAGITPAAVAIGFPSTLDRERKRLLSTPNLEGMNGLNIVEELEAILHIPVYIDRDVNLLFLYDCHDYRLHGDVMIGCYAGTGLGNVVAIHGEILIGKNGVAAELGHIPMLGMSGECPCGNRGCVEMYASGKRLKEIQEAYFPETPIGELFRSHGESKALAEFLECLSIPIAAEINILDPDDVILGGGVFHMPSFPRERFEALLLSHTRKPYPAENLHLIYSRETQENGVIGAGIRGFLEMRKDGRG